MDELATRVKNVLGKANPESKKKEVRKLELESQSASFWQDHQLAAEKMQRLASLQNEIAKLEKLEEWVLEKELGGGSGESPDTKEITSLVNELETLLYLSGPYDRLNAVVSIHSGQGGVEAMDWAGMLHRMYIRFVELKGFKWEEIDFQPGEEAGIKEVVFQVDGEFAYGLLKNESGVHRLVRQSPFNADNLRQTSFALVEVVPLLDAGAKLEIKDEDLEWDFFRSSGKGGQNVNKVSTAVRLKHKSTGIIVTCQKERSQEQNRHLALNLLRGKLLQLDQERQRAEELRLRGKHITPGWGNQIRSYVLHPYHLVKDLRSEYEETDSDSVLDGKIDKFIEAELKYFAKTD